MEYVLDENWSEAYQNSEMWKDMWATAHNQGEPWPEGVRILQNKMYLSDKLCVPETVSHRLMRSLHVQVGHVGNKRTIKELRLRFLFAPSVKFEEVVARIRRACDVCQASEPPNWGSKGPIRVNPVPERLWFSVSRDMFSMPPVE